MRLRLHPGEIWTVMRFGLVGAAATLTYLVCSIILLGSGIAPVTVNLIAFAVSLTLSYLGQYYFTYRAANAHARLSLRYAIATLVLIAICSILHRGLLQLALDPRLASLAVTIAYPLLSFILNHGWAYRRGAVGPAMTVTGGK